MLLIKLVSISLETILRRMSGNTFDDKSAFLRAMAWCRQALTHNLSQCWPTAMWSYGVITPNNLSFDSLKCLAISTFYKASFYGTLLGRIKTYSITVIYIYIYKTFELFSLSHPITDHVGNNVLKRISVCVCHQYICVSFFVTFCDNTIRIYLRPLRWCCPWFAKELF